MATLPRDTWIRLIVWMVIGLVIYFLYGAHHSVLGAGKPSKEDEPGRHGRPRVTFVRATASAPVRLAAASTSDGTPGSAGRSPRRSASSVRAHVLGQRRRQIELLLGRWDAGTAAGWAWSAWRSISIDIGSVRPARACAGPGPTRSPRVIRSRPE